MVLWYKAILYLLGGVLMIDAIQLPILLKAIDFIFDEGHKILEERRERRKKENQPPAMENQELSNREPASSSEIVPLKPEEAAEIRQDLLASKVDETLWHDNEQELQHLVRLYDTYSRNYYLTREQYAKWGDALVPAIIVHNLREAENAMVETIQRMERVLSKIYKKNIPPLE
jgi:hypothetical protein